MAVILGSRAAQCMVIFIEKVDVMRLWRGYGFSGDNYGDDACDNATCKIYWMVEDIVPDDVNYSPVMARGIA